MFFSTPIINGRVPPTQYPHYEATALKRGNGVKGWQQQGPER